MSARPINGYQAVLHKVVTEETVNTFKQEKVEVPNSTNCRSVRLDRVVIVCGESEAIAATLTKVHAGVGVGDIVSQVNSAGLCSAATPGVCAEHEHFKGCLTGVTTPNLLNSRIKEMHPGRFVPKGADGKYYVTVGLKGSSNVGVKSVSYDMEFTVMQ